MLLPNIFQSRLTPESSRHQLEPSHPQNAVWMLDELSTNRLHHLNGLEDQHRKTVCRWTMKWTNKLNTVSENEIIQHKLKKLKLTIPYHVAVLMTKKNSIAIKQRSVATSSSFSLKAHESFKLLSRIKKNSRVQ
jgi:hypothetical protein